MDGDTVLATSAIPVWTDGEVTGQETADFTSPDDGSPDSSDSPKDPDDSTDDEPTNDNATDGSPANDDPSGYDPVRNPLYWPTSGAYYSPRYGLTYSPLRQPPFSSSYRSSSSSSTEGGASHPSSSSSSVHNVGTSHPSPSTKDVKRIAGANRYSTMSENVSANFTQSDWAIVASGANFPDALSAVALAGAHRAPVILTDPHALSKEAANQIDRLGVKHIILLGGESALSSTVEDAIRTKVADVKRIYGPDRVMTSVAAMLNARATDKASDTVIIATGSSYADALSAGAWAWKTTSPIVLTGTNGKLSKEAVEAIKADAGIKRVIIMGGTAVVSDDIKTQLGAGFSFERLGGADRYATSALMAGFACNNGLTWSKPSIATGHGFADALSGAACAGRTGSPLLLADGGSDQTIAALKTNAKSVQSAVIIGGTSAVSASVEDAVRSSIG